jgi:hypothetical protein
MSHDNIFEGETPVIRLRVWALGQMIWGAFLAGVGLAVIAGILLATWVVGLLLPEQSKKMPSPYGAVEIVRVIEVV